KWRCRCSGSNRTPATIPSIPVATSRGFARPLPRSSARKPSSTPRPGSDRGSLGAGEEVPHRAGLRRVSVQTVEFLDQEFARLLGINLLVVIARVGADVERL